MASVFIEHPDGRNDMVDDSNKFGFFLSGIYYIFVGTLYLLYDGDVNL